MTDVTVSALPLSRADWRALALRLAEWPVDQAPAGERADFSQLRDTAWDVASYAAFWNTVQLPSLGPGLLPLTVMGVVAVIALAGGHLPESWPDFSSPFLLWPCLWLLAWFGGTLVLAAIRHRRAQRRVLSLGARLSLFPSSA